MDDADIAERHLPRDEGTLGRRAQSGTQRSDDEIARMDPCDTIDSHLTDEESGVKAVGKRF